jgi:hypothetical protein
MSVISSNSLFHFTPEKKNLLGILHNEFLPRYSFENVKLKSDSLREGMAQAIPMICFCDISLGQIQDHVKEYGNYGIGMTKEWGIRKKLNPVIYTNSDSSLSNSFHELTHNIMELLGEKCTVPIKKTSDEFMNLLNFLKPYEGFSAKNPEKKVRFYDEKEWRYVPNITFDDRKSLSNEEFKNETIREKANIELEVYKLGFNINDIKYIFIKSNNEIHEFVEAIRNIKGHRYSTQEVDILTTKITTIENLKEDF